jgi:uncharacterized damage-inducible protein DinB
MKASDLYPYWEEIHEDLIESLSWLPEEILDFKPLGSQQRSIRQLVGHMIDRERYWIVKIVQGLDSEPIKASNLANGELLIETVEATRARTLLLIDSLEPPMLSAVRVAPADSQTNEPETNRQIAWFIWQVVQNEIYHFGQIQMLMSCAVRQIRDA